MAARDAPTAIGPTGEPSSRPCCVRQRRRSSALAAKDRFARGRCARRPAARLRQRPDEEIDGAVVSSISSQRLRTMRVWTLNKDEALTLTQKHHDQHAGALK